MKEDLTGQKFNRLTVIGVSAPIPNKHGPYHCWVCKCTCGNITQAKSWELKSGHKKSCGCLKREGNYTTHKKSYTRIYSIYQQMKQRCCNINCSNYPNYGGRGITVCDEWLKDFRAFYDWAVSNGYAENLSIDRIDNNKGYSPHNCRWTTSKTQANNVRSNHIVLFKGKQYTLTELSELLDVETYILRRRIVLKGLSDDELLKSVNEFRTQHHKLG